MSRVGETGVGETGIGETGVGEMGVGETGTNQNLMVKPADIGSNEKQWGQNIMSSYHTTLKNPSKS